MTLLHTTLRADEPPSAEPPGSSSGVWRFVELVGRTLIGLGVFVLLFVAFQLWGTGLQERRAQQELADELAAELAADLGNVVTEREPVPSTSVAADGFPADDVSARPEVITIPARPNPESGRAVARIEAPTIDLDKTVVEGVGRVQLRAGPGRYPISALPGHAGHVAIAGHRTTHGSPFADLDQLEPGDPITLETVDGVFTYRVEAHHDADGVATGHRIVEPDDIGVIAERGDNRLTLTSCHPRYSDRQRLVVTAVLEGTPVAFAQAPPLVESSPVEAIEASPPLGSPGTEPPLVDEASVDSELDRPLGWQFDQLDAVAAWALLVLAAAMPSWWLRRRGRPVLAAALLPAVVVVPLFNLMVSLDHLVPAV